MERGEIEAIVARIKSQNSIHNWNMPLKDEALSVIQFLLDEVDRLTAEFADPAEKLAGKTLNEIEAKQIAASPNWWR